MEYNFGKIEEYWQNKWKKDGIYKVPNESSKPKYYVLDMFPYPSGAGLHVGHPLGYIASDIYARFKRLKGYNVLHPMGYDAFGLPAEQYAIDHGIHPAISTEANIKNFRSQLDKIGFSFDWEREVNTSKPDFYKWTQWIFLQLFDSFYNRKANKADRISVLIEAFEKEGNVNHEIPNDKFQIQKQPFTTHHSPLTFTAEEWKSFDEKTQQDILMEYRLAYCGVGEVNWCEALGTVLANDEVINGVSERGGYPVVRKKLRQWYMRITEYADRLLEGLTRVDFSDAMKEMQSNWIGKSSGAEMEFGIRKPPLTPPKGENTTPKYQTAQPSLYDITKMFAEEKRKNPTHEEQIMWQLLRANKTGFHIKRQHIIGSYIVDFACLDKLVTIEIDGGYHNNPEMQFYDKERTAFLKANGFTELRFTNEEVRQDANTVVKKITEDLSKKESVLKKSDAKVSPPAGGGDLEGASLRVYTTRPDTIFGVDFMVIAPEHELVKQITSEEQKTEVEKYLEYVNSRNERERMAEKKITGVFTGSYAINPFDGRAIPIWISEYVLAGYGTGAIMAVPCGDQRDFLFAKHFNIPITNIIGKDFNGEEANPTKDAILENSDFINGMMMKDAIDVVIDRIEEMGIGVRKVNYKMRDAAFSRQRYWGEPIPIKWINGIAHPLDESELPLELPHVDSYKPGPEGEGPLANIPEWLNKKVKLAKQSESSEVSPLGGDLEGALETNTMPGYAGSSWYFLRYMDPKNEKEFCDHKASDYWGQVDLYIGGTEHAVGHLLYSRMWTKVLYDLGYIGHDEPYKRLVNQGMIQGSSRLIFRVQLTSNNNDDKDIIATVYVSKGQVQKMSESSSNLNAHIEEAKQLFFKSFKIPQKVNGLSLAWLHVDVNIVDDHDLNIELFRSWKSEYSDAQFIFEDGSCSLDLLNRSNKRFVCDDRVEKMSKRYYNVINPDDLCNKYGADTFRMYEMFLGPVEMSKPWDTKGIEGVHRFLKKLWRLFYRESNSPSLGGGTGEAIWNENKATEAELKVLHKTIKKIEEDTERFSFNTGVSAFMIAVNELTDLKCHKKEILEPLLILLAPYAPHIAEELYFQLKGSQVSPLGGDLEGASSILNATYPKLEEKYLVESSKEYPVSINGKMRTTIDMALGIPESEVEKIVLANEVVKKWLEGKQPKKIIYKEGKMVNVVV